MIVRGVTQAELLTIAHSLDMELYNLKFQGTGNAFVLRLQENRRYQKRSHSGRRVHAICWHGHRDFMRSIFKLNPNAQIVTMLANYRGVDEFEKKYCETGRKNVGSIVEPMYFAEACDCNEGAR